jgi:hypothetical protein
MENHEGNAPQANDNKSSLDEVKNFYKEDFKNIFLTVFTNPIDGIYNSFKNPSPKAYTQSLILFGSVFALYIVGMYLFLGDASSFLPFSFFIKFGLLPVVLMLMITIISFGIKSISGKADFKAELLTGGLSGIPLAVNIVLLLLLKMFGSDVTMSAIKDPVGTGLMIVLVVLYIFLMLTNILQQSLKASGTKDAIAWYLSPVSIIIAVYLASRVYESFVL